MSILKILNDVGINDDLLADIGINSISELMESSNDNINNINKDYTNFYNYKPLNTQLEWLNFLYGDLLNANTKIELINALDDFKKTHVRLFLGARYIAKSDVLYYGLLMLLFKCIELEYWEIRILFIFATESRAKTCFTFIKYNLLNNVNKHYFKDSFTNMTINFSKKSTTQENFECVFEMIKPT